MIDNYAKLEKHNLIGCIYSDDIKSEATIYDYIDELKQRIRELEKQLDRGKYIEVKTKPITIKFKTKDGGTICFKAIQTYEAKKRKRDDRP